METNWWRLERYDLNQDRAVDAVRMVEPVEEDRVIDGVECSTEVDIDKDSGGTLVNGVKNAVEC